MNELLNEIDGKLLNIKHMADIAAEASDAKRGWCRGRPLPHPKG
jgi:hypothetical protein